MAVPRCRLILRKRGSAVSKERPHTHTLDTHPLRLRFATRLRMWPLLRTRNGILNPAVS